MANFNSKKKYYCCPTIKCGDFTKLMYLMTRDNKTNDAKNIIIDEINNNDLSYINQKNNLGWNALMIACGCSSFYDNFDIIQLLLNSGADINSQNNDGLTALMIVCIYKIYGCTNIIKLLLEYGANVNTQCNNGWTALMFVSRYFRRNKLKMVELLIDNGANIDIQNKNGQTVLLIECRYNNRCDNIEFIKLLLDYGANINHKCNNNETALIVAAKQHYLKIVKFLLDNHADYSIVDYSRKIFINYLYGQQSISCLKIINDIEYTKKCKKYIHQQLFQVVNEFLYRPNNFRHKLINAKLKLFTNTKINNFNITSIISDLKLFHYFSIYDIESFQIRINELELMHLDK
ncbi:putative ankyrin repeat protein [Powai lake megavirus]|uniref:Putative ankyrin repeat protein n=1 Tax=Powai lake megavirus TaxID=1842663 RepID=A0A167RF77_9VIRU|nr:putative ankyrin repeat protein [Powai lake megavirus]ANB50614.1 putative ankyrin repeat protein [Powai lake megavirus]WBF70765.1 putative ankyrin repeat protein [Megavirus caiporensis]